LRSFAGNGNALASGRRSETEEAAIRALITSGQAKPTDDAKFWSGPFKRPFVLPDKGEMFPGHDVTKRTNVKSTTDVQRIEVAASGDLAYEFSLGSLEFDRTDQPSEHVAFKTGLLRVWKKVNGDWKIVAAFVRPLDPPFELPTTNTSK
jgi:hypothetical protein